MKGVKKMKKKILVILMTLTILFSLSISAFATVCQDCDYGAAEVYCNGVYDSSGAQYHLYGFLWLNTCYYWSSTYGCYAWCPRCYESNSIYLTHRHEEAGHDTGCGRNDFTCQGYFPGW